MEYAQVGGSQQNSQRRAYNYHATQAQFDSQYAQEHSLRSRIERMQQQQQQQEQLQQQQLVDVDTNSYIDYNSFVSYPETSSAPAPYSPEHDYYIPNSINIEPTDVQSQMHRAFYGENVGFSAPDATDLSSLEPRAYPDQTPYAHQWDQMVPSSVGIDDQLGLPPTTTGAEELYAFNTAPYPVTGADYNTFSDELEDTWIPPPEQQFDINDYSDHLEAPPLRGVTLFDSPVPDFPETLQQNDAQLWSSPQQKVTHTPETITQWFADNYASRRDPSRLPQKVMAEQNGGIWCKICRPYTFHDPLAYRQHKEEIHGIDFKTGFLYWAPLQIRPISGVVGIGYEGYCPTCLLWIALDLSKPDFNWFHHASRCQDPAYEPKPKKTKPAKQKPANPLDRWSSSSSEDEAPPIDVIKKEAIRMARQGEFLRPRPPFASNSNSNPSDEGSSDIFSSGSSQSVLTSNSNSNSSVNSAMSQHSLESRRKKVLRLRKRKGARSSNQGQRVYQCTFCMADFANFGDWRRHEEVIHLVLDKWVCAPEGQYKNGTRECVYCEEVHEEQSNIPNRCNASYCHGKGPAERVFARKDHLKQHLKRMHGIHQWRPSFEAWSKKAKGPRQSRCGFCGATFEDWQHRMQHVAWEFKNGQKMSMWEGDWGLENTWTMGNKLGNAILPKSRPDHISKTLKTEIDKLPTMQTLTPQSMSRVKSAPPGNIPQEDKGKRGLQRKPRLTSLRDIQQQQQLQQPDHQQYDSQTISPPVPWSLPSSANSAPHTTPPSRQSPLAPYSTNNPYPPTPNSVNTLLSNNIQIQPRPPESNAPMQVPSQGTKRVTKTPQNWQCPYCSTKYTRQDNLKRHVKTHFSRAG